MTDVIAFTGAPVRRFDFTSKEAQARVRRRYRAETRFRAYGIAALAITTVFVVVLVADILVKGLPAFVQHSLVLDVAIPADAFGPQRSAEEIKSADYFPITRDALKAAIPGIEGRVAERTLTRLLSTGAADVIRDRLVANPALIGTTINAPLLLSSGADLYLKGLGTKITSQIARGIATPSAQTGEVTILTSANDFVDSYLGIKRILAKRAKERRDEADRLERSGSTTVAERIAQLRSEADQFQARHDNPKGEEELDADMPSLLVAINGGLVKLTKLTDVSAVGEALLPLSSTAEAAPGTWRIVSYVLRKAAGRSPIRRWPSSSASGNSAM